jgi:ABC-2 type transport system ATP-binding protein
MSSLVPPPFLPEVADPNAPPIVSARGLRKRFGRREILHGLDFDIPPGRIYGLIGHNGAGKTTTLNALLGLTSYEGDVKVLGLDPYQNRARLMREVAFISDVASLPRFLTVKQLFDLVAGIHPRFDRARAVSFLGGTEVRMHAVIRALSKGMLAQLHLAVVMAIDARLLVLDEPTLGLDITYRRRFYRRLLEDYMTAHRTLLITTHQVEEIESMLTDVMFIRDGSLVLHTPMRDMGTTYTQLVVKGDNIAQARALDPIYSETRFGQTVMVFAGVPREQLEPLGEVSTPTISDLFVALMTKPEDTSA